MGLSVTKRVWEHSQQRGSGLLLMLALANHANRDSVCWPKIRVLAEEIRLTARQTKDLLAKLEAAGEIEIRRNTSGEKYASNYLVKVGSDCITWPDGPPARRVKPGAGTGEAGFTRKPKRVKSSVKTGEVQFTPTGEVQRERVKPGAGTGEAGCIVYKESEPSNEPSIDSPSENPYTVRPELEGFHSELQGLPGYRPTERFFRQVLDKYRGVDLVEEAMGMAAWLNTPSDKLKGRTPLQAGRQCTPLFVLRWLGRSLTRLQDQEAASHDRSNGTNREAPHHAGEAGGRAGIPARSDDTGRRTWGTDISSGFYDD